MRAVFEILEAAAIVFLIGLVVILGVAATVHTFFDPPEPKRARLDMPPFAMLCPLDAAGHCRAQ